MPKLAFWGGWGGKQGGGKGVIKHCESGFLFIFLQIYHRLTSTPNFIKIGQKMPKLVFWGGWGDKQGVVEG